jgi:hypothetical protein
VTATAAQHANHISAASLAAQRDNFERVRKSVILSQGKHVSIERWLVYACMICIFEQVPQDKYKSASWSRLTFEEKKARRTRPLPSRGGNVFLACIGVALAVWGVRATTRR